MKTTKKIDLGEYVINIVYDKADGSLEVTILDELGDMIDAIVVTNDTDENNEIDINLN